MATDLARRVRALFERGVTEPLAEEAFDRIALDVVRHQLVHTPGYRAFAAYRGISATSVQHWTEAPAVPARAFASAPLIDGIPADAERVFRTTGTTRAGGRRGEHFVRDLSLYEAAALPNFARHLLPDGLRLPLVALVADPAVVADSSLCYMAGVVERRLSIEGGGYFFHPERGLDLGALDERVGELCRRGQPMLVLGTAFALVHWTDALAQRGTGHALPAGSRVMETGGFKGRSREVSRPELYSAVARTLGIAEGMIVAEYGMTELLSQFYEPVLDRPGADGERAFVGPPWVRTRILDPETLAPAGPGEPGVLHHMDLANVHSVASVLTADLGAPTVSGFRLLGRAVGGEPRGCSLAMEDFLAARESAP